MESLKSMNLIRTVTHKQGDAENGNTELEEKDPSILHPILRKMNQQKDARALRTLAAFITYDTALCEDAEKQGSLSSLGPV